MTTNYNPEESEPRTPQQALKAARLSGVMEAWEKHLRLAEGNKGNTNESKP